MVQLERLRLMAHIGYLPFRSFAGLEQRTMERSNPIMFVALRDCPVLIRQLQIIFVIMGRDNFFGYRVPSRASLILRIPFSWGTK